MALPKIRVTEYPLFCNLKPIWTAIDHQGYDPSRRRHLPSEKPPGLISPHGIKNPALGELAVPDVVTLVFIELTFRQPYQNVMGCIGKSFE
jgi:hypothetical protein